MAANNAVNISQWGLQAFNPDSPGFTNFDLAANQWVIGNSLGTGNLPQTITVGASSLVTTNATGAVIAQVAIPAGSILRGGDPVSELDLGNLGIPRTNATGSDVTALNLTGANYLPFVDDTGEIVAGNLTGAGNITVSSPTAGVITITGDAGLNWALSTTTTEALNDDSGIIASEASAVTCQLPTNPTLGAEYGVSADGTFADPWIVEVQGTNDIIHCGTQSTTAGPTGNITATETYDSIRILCVDATVNTAVFVVLNCVGNLTIN